MNLLAFETSSPVLTVALKKGEGKPLQARTAGLLTHAENLVPSVERLLKKKKLTIEKIDTFLIGRGPGSFTGLRIGFAALKGFLAFRKKPCAGALSFDLIAEGIRLAEGSLLCAALDARREKIYARFYRCSQDRWIPAGKPLVLSLEELLSKLPAGIHLAGDALKRFGKELRGKSGEKKIRFLPEKFWYPEARTLLCLYGEKDKKIVRLEKPADFVPLYFRLSGAEENKRGNYAGRC